MRTGLLLDKGQRTRDLYKSLTADPFKYLGNSYSLAFADSPEAVQMLNECLEIRDLDERIAELGITMYVFID